MWTSKAEKTRKQSGKQKKPESDTVKLFVPCLFCEPVKGELINSASIKILYNISAINFE